MSIIKEIENTWITLSDGCRLAARIWMPENAELNPVPAIMEYLPYRKRDFTAMRDSTMHRFFAQHGYAAIRVDLRGSGDSEGILRDEYLQQELDDGLEVLQWIASQAWCNGSIGMIGLSWGGFNGLQIAELHPKELKAVISVCSSDHRYTDDVHYMGGCLLTDNLSWASTMFAYNTCPPDPQLVGEKWREMWRERLAGSGLWIKNWLEHQSDDEFWQHASVYRNYEGIQCPVFAVSGWADGYSNTVFRLMKNLKVPRKGLIGAWGHKYPQMGKPEPAIGFLQESVRWWDHWLKEKETGIMDEPMLRVWMQDNKSPLSVKQPGRWVGEKEWPAPGIDYQTFPLNTGEINFEGKAEEPEELEIQSPLTVGLFAGKWYSYSANTDLPNDQREEDGGALVFDSPVLEDSLEILGEPVVELKLRSNKPVAMVAVRLSDMAPDGKITRVTYGVLNLTHRNNHTDLEELDVNTTYDIKVPLNHIAQSFPAGNRIRVAISTSYWPLVWPSPEPANLTILSGKSSVSLPVRNPKDSDEQLPAFGPPEEAQPIETTLLIPQEREWKVINNLATNENTLEVVNNDNKIRIEDYNWEFYRTVDEKYSFTNNNYDTVRGEVKACRSFKRGDWNTEIHTRTVLTSTRTHFRLSATLDAYEGDSRVFSKTWNELIPRYFV